VPIVLQKSQVAGRRIFRENPNRKQSPILIASLALPRSPKQIIEQIQLAGRATTIKIDPIVMVSGADQFDAAFAKMAQESSDAVVVHASLPPKNIADLALKYRLPIATSLRQFVEAGGLVSYGALESDLWRRSGIFVHKILQGSRPADLPVEQPVKFELVVNLDTAKALGLAVPQTFLLRADEVIE
jgi:putative ABC transport system substrate-binding protein